MNPLDSAQALQRSLWLRKVRRWIVYGVVLVALAELHGLPAVRVKSNRQMCYFGVDGTTHAYGNAPLVAIRPLEHSLLDYAETGWKGLRHALQDSLDR